MATVASNLSISEQTLGYHDESYESYIEALEPCPGCGQVDELNIIEGQLVCAACSTSEHDDDLYDPDDEYE